MTIKLTFEFDGISDAATFLVKNTDVAPAKLVDDPKDVQDETPEPKITKKQRGKRAPKKEALQKKLDDAAELTENDCRTKLQEVVTAKGIKTAKEILKAYKASRIPELKSNQYADFIQACEGVLD